MTLIPKAELHCHIEGAVAPDLALKQAEKYGVDITPLIVENGYKWHDFTSFLAAYDAVASLFKTEEDYAQLAEHYLTEIAADGAIYSEIFVSPDHAVSAGLEPEDYFDGLSQGIKSAEAKTGIIGRMIVVGIRHLGKDRVEWAAQIAAQSQNPLITGFGMAGDERIGDISDFTKAFDTARDAGLGITVHAGELVGAESVRGAIEHLKPSRIGHGVRAIEDPSLVAQIADENIVLEVCPGSNIALNVFENASHHPLKKLIDAGVTVTLNSDDPPFFATSLKGEYDLATTHFKMSDDELKTITRNAIGAAFVDNETKRNLLAQT